MATGGNMEGGEPLEAGASKNNFDYLHVINWKKAEEVVAAGQDRRDQRHQGASRLQTAADEGVLYLIPEPKSPHGVDVDPSGALHRGRRQAGPARDGLRLRQDADGHREKRTTRARTPSACRSSSSTPSSPARSRSAPGPLHTQFDSKGHGYTSLFLDSAVAKFTLGEDVVKTGEEAFTLIEKIPVHYNIGHLAIAEGDTVSPDDKYLVALNKWSIDRFLTVGPLHPQNFQLIDLKGGKDRWSSSPTCPSA